MLGSRGGRAGGGSGGIDGGPPGGGSTGGGGVGGIFGNDRQRQRCSEVSPQGASTYVALLGPIHALYSTVLPQSLQPR